MAVLVPQDLMGALKHEVRRRIIKTMTELDRSVSPKELSERIGIPLSNVSYHVRVLREAGAISLANEEAVRGSVQHFYEMEEELKRLPWLQEILQEPEDSSGPEKESDGQGGGAQ